MALQQSLSSVGGGQSHTGFVSPGRKWGPWGGPFLLSVGHHLCRVSVTVPAPGNQHSREAIPWGRRPCKKGSPGTRGSPSMQTRARADAKTRSLLWLQRKASHKATQDGFHNPSQGKWNPAKHRGRPLASAATPSSGEHELEPGWCCGLPLQGPWTTSRHVGAWDGMQKSRPQQALGGKPWA